MRRIISIILAATMILTAVASMTGCKQGEQVESEVQSDVVSDLEIESDVTADNSTSSDSYIEIPATITLSDSDYEAFVNNEVIPKIGIADFNEKKINAYDSDNWKESYELYEKEILSPKYTGLLGCYADDIDNDGENELLCAQSFSEQNDEMSIKEYKIKLICYKKYGDVIKVLDEMILFTGSYDDLISKKDLYVFLTKTKGGAKYISVLNDTVYTSSEYNEITVYSLSDNKFNVECGFKSGKDSDGGPYGYSVSKYVSEDNYEDIYCKMGEQGSTDDESYEAMKKYYEGRVKSPSDSEMKKYLYNTLSEYGISKIIFDTSKDEQLFLYPADETVKIENTTMLFGYQSKIDEDYVNFCINQKDYTGNKITY